MSWVYQRCSSISGKLKDGSKFQYQAYLNHQADVAKDGISIELNGQPFEIVEKCCLGDTIEAGWSEFDSAKTKIRS